MKEWFIKRNYPEAIIEKEMKKVCFSKQGQKSEKVEKGGTICCYLPSTAQ